MRQTITYFSYQNHVILPLMSSYLIFFSHYFLFLLDKFHFLNFLLVLLFYLAIWEFMRCSILIFLLYRLNLLEFQLQFILIYQFLQVLGNQDMLFLSKFLNHSLKIFSMVQTNLVRQIIDLYFLVYMLNLEKFYIMNVNSLNKKCIYPEL